MGWLLPTVRSLALMHGGEGRREGKALKALVPAADAEATQGEQGPPSTA